jgi:hypothetical protein
VEDLVGDFDEERPSIVGRKISANIPPTILGFEESRWWLRSALGFFVALLVLVSVLVAWLR